MDRALTPYEIERMLRDAVELSKQAARAGHRATFRIIDGQLYSDVAMARRA